MSKQSLSAVPPDVAKPEVLKRFLSRLVEELDIVLGFRGTGKDKYVSQQELNSAAETLSSLSAGLSDATRHFQQLRKDLSTLILEASTLLDKIAAVENYAQSVGLFAETQTWLKMFELDFKGTAVNGVIAPTRQFNVATLTRVGAGRYDVAFISNSFLGTTITDNTKVVVEFRIEPAATTSVFSVEYVWNANVLELYIWQHEISGTNLVRSAYDPTGAADSIRVSGLIARPSAGVPV